MPDELIEETKLIRQSPVNSTELQSGLTMRDVLPFLDRSVSEETRRSYRRVVRDFLAFFGDAHPSALTPVDIQRYRTHIAGGKNKRAAASTVAFKLSVVRSFYNYLLAGGYVTANPAQTKLVPPPPLPDDLRGRALTIKEVRYLVSGPNREAPEGARDYALLLLLLRTGLRISEACRLQASSIKWNGGRWTLRFKKKGGKERSTPLPTDVKKAIDEYLKLDRVRRSALRCDGAEAYIFQPHTNYRTLVFAKPLSSTMGWHIVKRWAGFTGIGHVSPHDLRRTAITRALDQDLTYRQVQMMSGHKDPKNVMRYDHARENLDQSAVNFLNYDEAPPAVHK